MKSNKGFTLIELLAVIVILAIIALIATPVILGVVETARKGAAQSSILGYIDAVEKQIMINEMNESNTDDFNKTEAYTLTELKDTYKVTVKGDVPSAAYHDVDGTPAEGLMITDGEVQTTVFVTKDKRYDVTYDKATGKATAEPHNNDKYAAK